jgi:MHS family proline/betaine transporter-like MFS transporter
MKHIKAISIALIGTVLEYYDIMLYSFFAASLAPLFFPHEDPLVTQFASMASFAAGFIMRPLGGIFFGHMGDKYGRKKALTLSILLVVIPTFIIGLLPTYSQIGLLAPIILIACRLLQGFCVGGESTGALTFIIEHSPIQKSGFASSLMISSCYLGGLIGTIIGLLATQPYMPEWGWRIPFILGGIVGIFGFYLRHKLEETPIFLQAKTVEPAVHLPILKVLKTQKESVLKAAAISAGAVIPFYLVSVYGNEILKNQLLFTTHEILFVDMVITFIWVTLHPIMGWLSDKIGPIQFMRYAAIALMIGAYPLFALINHLTSSGYIFSMQIGLSILGIAFSAPCCFALTSLFSPLERYTGVAVGHSIGSALLGGTTPLIALALVQILDDPRAPFIYLLFAGVIGYLGLMANRKLKGTLSSESNKDA